MSKKYLIFGATGAVGTALAKSLYEDSFDCHLIGKNENELKQLSSKLNYSYSVSNVTELNFVQKIQEEISSVEILGIAYCVGSINIKPLKNTSASDFISTYVLNLVSAVDVIRIFEKNLKSNNGSVVLFSTVAAKKGFANHSIISSAIAAVEGLRVALAAELAPHVRINCIAPSLTKSKISESVIKNSSIAESIAKTHPLKRIGEASDSANLASFLLTEKSSWITGQIIAVDGGRSSIA